MCFLKDIQSHPRISVVRDDFVYPLRPIALLIATRALIDALYTVSLSARSLCYLAMRWVCLFVYSPLIRDGRFRPYSVALFLLFASLCIFMFRERILFL